MDQLEILQQWLQTCPGWQDTLAVDSTAPEPGSAGLFPGGLEELSRKADVTGAVRIHNRLHFTLYRVTAQPSAQAARWLLQLQHWINRQSAAGLAPRLGDDPAYERIRATGGKRKAVTAPGTATYQLQLTAEYMKHEKGE